MGRILHCLLWAVLATTSAYKSHYNNFDYTNFGYYQAPYRPSYNRRHDWPGPHRHGHERISERSTETNEFGERTNSHISENAGEEFSNGRVSERTNEFSNGRDSERTNEFSISNGRGSERNEFSNRDYEDARTNERAPRTNERVLPRTNERVSPRMNERSIEVTSSIQRVQQQERKRQQTREEPRADEEGSYKILNKFPLTHRRGAEDRVVFPDDHSSSSPHVQSRRSEPSFLDNLPESCQELGICDDLPDEEAYNDIVNGALRKYADPRSLKTIDELDNPTIAQRIGTDSLETQLCTYQERVMMPKVAKDKDDKWHILLNRNQDPIQGYRVEICSQGRSNCTSGIFHFYKGYTGYCKQKYSFRPMTAVDPSTNTTYTVALKVPSCCSCVAMQV